MCQRVGDGVYTSMQPPAHAVTLHTRLGEGVRPCWKEPPAAGKGLVLFTWPPQSNRENKARGLSSLGHDVSPGVFLTQVGAQH